MVACFFGKTDHVATVPLEQCSMVNSEWYTTICLANIFGAIRKTNKREDESLFTITMPVLAYRLKSTPFWPSIPLNGWVKPRTALTWHPVTSFYFRTSRKYCVVNDFRQTPIFVKLVFSSHCKEHKLWSYVKMFWIQLCLKVSNFPIKMSNCIWKHQKYARLI